MRSKNILMTTTLLLGATLLLVGCGGKQEVSKETKSAENTSQLSKTDSVKDTAKETTSEQNLEQRKNTLENKEPVNVQASEEEIQDAASGGEYEEARKDVEVDGVTVSGGDISNARKTIEDAGLGEGYFSDNDIAKVIKKASDDSVDIVTAAKAFLGL